MILVGISMFLCKGTYFSVQAELGISTKISATAVAIATFIGYLPDMFTGQLFGGWIDAYGNDAYPLIIGFGVGTAALGVVAAIIALVISRRVAKRAQKA